MIPQWWSHSQTPEQIHSRALWHLHHSQRLLSLLPTDYFADPLSRRHSDVPRGEGIEASEIEGVTP